jgi:hypothetical protein
MRKSDLEREIREVVTQYDTMVKEGTPMPTIIYIAVYNAFMEDRGNLLNLRKACKMLESPGFITFDPE